MLDFFGGSLVARIRRRRPAWLTSRSGDQHPAAVLFQIQAHDDRASCTRGLAALASEGHRHEQQATLEEDVAENQIAHVRDDWNLKRSATAHISGSTNECKRKTGNASPAAAEGETAI